MSSRPLFGEPREHPGPQVRLPNVVYALLAVIVAAAILGAGFGLGAFIVSLQNAPKDPHVDTTHVDTLIIGGGPGGIVTAYRIAKQLGNEAMIINSRDYWGGKVYSYRLPTSPDSAPIHTPTHAEQFRAGDAIVRCLAQEVGLPCENRPGPISHVNAVVRGVNATNIDCYATPDETPNAVPGCDAGYVTDRYGPNGDHAIYPNAPSFCGESDWKSCSEVNEYFNVVLDEDNIASIEQGETWSAYVLRLFGESGSQFFKAMSGYEYAWAAGADAKMYIEYLLYDFEYDYSNLPVPVGGPQQLWKKLIARVINNGTRAVLNTRAVSVKRVGGHYNYLTKLSNGDQVLSKRVVFAMPPKEFANLSRDIIDDIKGSKFIKYAGNNKACTWNAFFPSNWWQTKYTTCTTGYCTQFFNEGTFDFDSNNATRDRATWSFTGDEEVPFLQYVGTKERKIGHLLRMFIEEDACNALNSLLSVGGQDAVTTEIMARLRNVLPDDTIPDPVATRYSFEVYAYSLPIAGGDFTAQDMLDWAVEPLSGEKVCFATEGLNMLDSGWQEGAAVVAHNCLKGPVFSDLFDEGEIETKFERCTNVFTNRTLIKSSPEYDQCLLLANEISMKDAAGLEFCGGPTDFVVEWAGDGTVSMTAYSEEDTNEAAAWQDAVTEPVLADPRPIRRSHRYQM